MVPFGGPHRADSACLNFTVIGMRAKADDAQFAILRRHGYTFDCGRGRMADKPKARSNADEFFCVIKQLFHKFLSNDVENNQEIGLAKPGCQEQEALKREASVPGSETRLQPVPLMTRKAVLTKHTDRTAK